MKRLILLVMCLFCSMPVFAEDDANQGRWVDVTWYEIWCPPSEGGEPRASFLAETMEEAEQQRDRLVAAGILNVSIRPVQKRKYVGTGATATERPSDERPIAPERPGQGELEDLRQSLESQVKDIDTKTRSISRFEAWIRRESRAIDSMKNELQTLETAIAVGEVFWRTRKNPNCDSGLTYAKCQCADGRTEKERVRNLLDDMKDRADELRMEVNRSVDNYNAQLPRYRDLLAEEDRLWRNYEFDRDRYNNMTGNKAKGSPDSFKEVEENSRGR